MNINKGGDQSYNPYFTSHTETPYQEKNHEQFNPDEDDDPRKKKKKKKKKKLDLKKYMETPPRIDSSA